MTAPAGDDPRQNRALARFAAVQTVLQGRQNGLTLTQALLQAAQQPWEGRYYAIPTIESWVYRYTRGQFAALQDQPRRDKGKNRSLDAAATEALLELRRQHPQLPLKALEAELLRRGILLSGAYSVSTLQRRLTEAGLDRRSLRAGSALIGGPTKAFELPLPNMLWMADCMHGPSVRLSDGSLLRTFLFALLDDCSRLCVHGQFYLYERLEGFLDTLRQAVQNRGLPDKLYTDNGPAFRSQHLQIVCANLGIRLLHCKPYHSWSKGKIERFFLTVQTQFMPTLLFEPVHSIEELNVRFWRWSESEYHRREHSALGGESPSARFARLGTALRLLARDAQIERFFLMRETRRVRKDVTFSLGGRFWEAPTHLRGQLIALNYEPVGLSRVEIWLADRYIGPAALCDKHRNAQMPSTSNDYEQPAR